MADSNKQLDLLPLRRLPRSRARRLELKIEGILYRLHDIGGHRFATRYLRKGILRPDYFIRLGARGPELVFVLNRSLFGLGEEQAGSHDPVFGRETAGDAPHSDFSSTFGGAQIGQDDGIIPSSSNGRLVRRFWRHSRLTLGVMSCVLVVIASYAGWGNRNLTRANSVGQVAQLETVRAGGGEDYLQIGRMIGNLLYRGAGAQDLAMRNADKDFVEREIQALMEEFGAEEYNVPPEFVRAVNHHISQYQDRDRDEMTHALVDERQSLQCVREILRRDQLPEDLAYIALVESGLLQMSESSEGAVGFWQFTEATARDYGLQVNESVDERLDLRKSTEAASRYIRELILDFGAGSSVMLAMAAYNSGPEKVRHAVRSVKDPIKQRNFWYLYSTQALPAETREYVPKVFAASIIGRNPRRFGF